MREDGRFVRSRSGLLVPDRRLFLPIAGAAAPSFVSFSTYNASALNPTTYTPNMVGGGAWLANDILVFVFETDLDRTPSVSGGSETWTQFPWSPQVSSGATVLNAFWARSSQTDPTAPAATWGTGPNHAVGAVCAIRGCATSGDPWDVDSSGNNAAANATIPGATTTVAECLVLILCSSGFNGTNAVRFSTWSNTDLAGVSEVFDQVDTIGNGGGFGAAIGTKVAAGTYGSTTVTEAFAGHGYATIAFKPPAAPVVRPTFAKTVLDAVNRGSRW
jgi:hypothetical protein